MNTSHTPTPWQIRPDTEQPLHLIWSDDGFLTLVARTCFAPASQANAQFIVRAVNSHEALVAALERAKDHIICGNQSDKQEALKQSQRALSLANS